LKSYLALVSDAERIRLLFFTLTGATLECFVDEIVSGFSQWPMVTQKLVCHSGSTTAIHVLDAQRDYPRKKVKSRPMSQKSQLFIAVLILRNNKLS
jgi:hypothetical protein